MGFVLVVQAHWSSGARAPAPGPGLGGRGSWPSLVELKLWEVEVRVISTVLPTAQAVPQLARLLMDRDDGDFPEELSELNGMALRLDYEADALDV